MPELKTERKTKKVILPSYPDSEVEIYEGLTTGDFIEMTGAEPKAAVLEAVRRLVKDWNFTDSKGEKLPVSDENLKALPLPDVLFLFKESGLQELSEELKKNASGSS